MKICGIVQKNDVFEICIFLNDGRHKTAAFGREEPETSKIIKLLDPDAAVIVSPSTAIFYLAEKILNNGFKIYIAKYQDILKKTKHKKIEDVTAFELADYMNNGLPVIPFFESECSVGHNYV